MAKVLSARLIATLVASVGALGFVACALALVMPSLAPRLTGGAFISAGALVTTGLVLSRLELSGFGDTPEGPLPSGVMDKFGWIAVGAGFFLGAAVFGTAALLLARGMAPEAVFPRWL